MHNSQLLKLLITFLLIGSKSFSQDFLIFDNDVTQTDAVLMDVTVLNDSTVIVVGGWGGGGGVILKTSDYGNSWIKTECERAMYVIDFPTENVGYAAGEGTTVMKTVDAGENWEYLNTSVVEPAFESHSIAFQNADTGFVGLANGPGYAFLRTYTGGETWENFQQDTLHVRTKLQAINSSTVYGVNGGLSKSNDSGQTWSTVYWPYEWGTETYGMYFFDPDTGIVAIRVFSTSCWSPFNLARTTDGGENWTTELFDCVHFTSFHFLTSQIGYAVGHATSSGTRYLWRTQDKGANWSTFEYPVGEQYFETSCIATKIACVDTDTCYLPTNYGTIIKMTNATDGMVNTQQVQEPDQFFVYPNPTSHFLTLTSPSLLPGTHITAYNLAGQQVYARQLNQAHEQLTLDARQFGPAGMYLLHIQIPGQRAVVKKVVVQE